MLDFIINILSTPAMLVGLMPLLGLVLQGKPVEDVVKGSIFWLYPTLSIVFLIVAAISYYRQHIKMNSDSPKHLVKELNHDIDMIYEKADIHSSSQNDQSTASDQ